MSRVRSPHRTGGGPRQFHIEGAPISGDAVRFLSSAVYGVKEKAKKEDGRRLMLGTPGFEKNLESASSPVQQNSGTVSLSEVGTEDLRKKEQKTGDGNQGAPPEGLSVLLEREMELEGKLREFQEQKHLVFVGLKKQLSIEQSNRDEERRRHQEAAAAAAARANISPAGRSTILPNASSRPGIIAPDQRRHAFAERYNPYASPSPPVPQSVSPFDKASGSLGRNTFGSSSREFSSSSSHHMSSLGSPPLRPDFDRGPEPSGYFPPRGHPPDWSHDRGPVPGRGGVNHGFDPYPREHDGGFGRDRRTRWD